MSRARALSADRVADIRAALTPWADLVRRDLPWRRTRDPWMILVSEIMLQQTQVSRVIPKWEAFVATFPTAQSCARSSQAEVVRQWEGLGYHRRAMYLHRAAQAIVNDFDGRFPQELEELLSLPGVGPYTARAVLAFAFEDDAAVVDTNVGRILARAVVGERCSATAAQSLADALVPAGESWAWNQGMLDLGAMVCTKRSPQCGECPVNAQCAWFRRGLRQPDPAEGSASVSSGQSPFVGSDRQGRGRLLAALRLGAVAHADVAQLMGWPDDPSRANRVASTLVVDGLARARTDGYELA